MNNGSKTKFLNTSSYMTIYHMMPNVGEGFSLASGNAAIAACEKGMAWRRAVTLQLGDLRGDPVA